ncbi:hypothetical protein IG194_16505 [Pseudomonas sp. ADPe]|jgi:hypothetical protein|nr:hypothetical protein IG194_16505 [Pseudomonas sp. ADPe]
MMDEWKRLSDFDDLIARGVVIRSPSGGLYEEYVDIIVFDPLDRNRGMGGLIVSGRKAGMYLAIFPVESTEGRCLKKRWVIENWQRWFFPGVDVGDVYCARFPAPASLPKS